MLKPEDMTPEWARELFEKVGRRPMPGSYFNRTAEGEPCACLLGAIALSVGFTPYEGHEMIESALMRAGLPEDPSKYGDVIVGFDTGLRGGPPSARFRHHPWYQAAYQVGVALQPQRAPVLETGTFQG